MLITKIYDDYKLEVNYPIKGKFRVETAPFKGAEKLRKAQMLSSECLGYGCPTLTHIPEEIRELENTGIVKITLAIYDSSPLPAFTGTAADYNLVMNKLEEWWTEEKQRQLHDALFKKV